MVVIPVFKHYVAVGSCCI